MHQLYNVIEVIITAAEIGLADRSFALTPCSASHLAEQRWPNEVSPHTGVVENDSTSRPGERISAGAGKDVESRRYLQVDASREAASCHANEQDPCVVCGCYQVSLLGGQTGLYSQYF